MIKLTNLSLARLRVTLPDNAGKLIYVRKKISNRIPFTVDSTMIVGVKLVYFVYFMSV